MNFPALAISTSFVALALAACGGSDNDTNPATSAETGAATDDTGDPTPQTTTGEPATTAEDPTTDEPEPTTGDPTNAVDPCDRCDANAGCRGDQCVCDEGFDGDGLTCTDIDECAGKNDCAVDATCSNTPGGYDCACNDGYKGNGFSCNDIDECTEETDTCSQNANCANQDGGYKCTCKDGFNGDGFTCNGSKEFGDACKAGEDCASGVCLGAPYNACTVTCTQDVANDCGAQGVTGLCVLVADDSHVCAGDLSFGADKDDEVMQAGDKVKRDFQSKTDADLFLVNIAVPGDYLIAVTPDPDDDVQLEVYNGDASELGTVNMLGIGQAETGVINVQAAGVFFVVARNIGISNGSYTVEISKQ